MFSMDSCYPRAERTRFARCAETSQARVPQRPGPDNERAAIEFEIAALAECAHPHVVRLFGTSNVGKVRQCA